MKESEDLESRVALVVSVPQSSEDERGPKAHPSRGLIQFEVCWAER